MCTEGKSASLAGEDCQVWRNLFFELDGVAWEKCAANLNDPCGCTGVVTCDIVDPKEQASNIVELDMGSIGAKGVLPRTISYLEHLRKLDLSNNSITGLPDSICNLPKAVFAGNTSTCALDDNPLDCSNGSPPSCAKVCGAECTTGGCIQSSSYLREDDCTAWQNFSRNPLYTKWVEDKCGADKAHTDPCSCKFDSQTQCANGRITYIDMWQQSLPGSGGIPLALLDLTGLTFLDLVNNALQGTIPAAIGQLQQLTLLGLSGNAFTGTVPQELTTLKHLSFIILDNNPHLTGKLPAFNFSQFTQCCAMDGDPFTCPLPAGTTTCVGGALQSPSCTKHPPPTCIAFAPCEGVSSSLTHSDCRAWQMFTRDPQYVDWAEAKCGTNVHTDPCSCTFQGHTQCTKDRITYIDMGQQGIPASGGIPLALMDLTGLTILALWGNSLQGTIPTAIGQLQQLTTLALASNSLQGIIPAAIGQLQQLTYLSLDVNSFTGTVPQSLTTLRHLSFIALDNNPHLTGKLPAFNFSQFTQCCAMGVDVFTCPLPAGANTCDHCNGGAPARSPPTCK
jgi:Leucine-rich repeat (LRR) protein